MKKYQKFYCNCHGKWQPKQIDMEIWDKIKSLFIKKEVDKPKEEDTMIGEKQRLDALHKQARTQLKKTKKPVSYTF